MHKSVLYYSALSFILVVAITSEQFDLTKVMTNYLIKHNECWVIGWEGNMKEDSYR